MFKNRPLVSVVIPVYNREGFIGEVINSCIQQDYENLEIIVIDNNSSDDTVNVVNKISKDNEVVKLYKNDDNIGPVRNWEKGVKLARGKYVKILFSDDFIAENFISTGVKCLEEDKNLALYCTSTIIKNGNKVLRKNKYFDYHGKNSTIVFIQRILLGGKVSVSASHALFRAEDAISCFDIEIPNKINSDFKMHGIGPDALMFLNILNKYSSFYFDSRYLTSYTSHLESISVNTNNAKLILLHLLARAYYVEHKLNNAELERKFNSRVLAYLKRFRGEDNLGLTKIEDFYISPKEIKYNIFYSLKYNWNLVFKFRLRKKIKKFRDSIKSLSVK